MNRTSNSVENKKQLVDAIMQLKQDKNAVILAHYYQRDEIQEIADFTGDSLALAQIASKTTADIIVSCGVDFMAETAKILSPGKKVIVPDTKAYCSLADSCKAEDLKRFKEEHPGYTVISYANTSAEVKALSDVVVTSGNVKAIVDSFPADEKIMFGPDRNLGGYINRITGRNMLLWDGFCHVHEQFSFEELMELKRVYSDAEVLVHPECKKELTECADKVGSTKALLDYARQSNCHRFIVVTEPGILYEMRKKCPDKVFIPARKVGGDCANECCYMRLNTLEKLYRCLLEESPEVTIDPDLCARAVRPIRRMLEISEKSGLTNKNTK